MESDFVEIFKVSEEVTEKYAGEKSAILRLGQCILRLAAPLL
jgi:cardiolipin synthase